MKSHDISDNVHTSQSPLLKDVIPTLDLYHFKFSCEHERRERDHVQTSPFPRTSKSQRGKGKSNKRALRGQYEILFYDTQSGNHRSKLLRAQLSTPHPTFPVRPRHIGKGRSQYAHTFLTLHNTTKCSLRLRTQLLLHSSSDLSSSPLIRLPQIPTNPNLDILDLWERILRDRLTSVKRCVANAKAHVFDITVFDCEVVG